MKKNFESGLFLGGGLGVGTILFGIAAYMGYTVVMVFGALTMVAGLLAIAAIEREARSRG